MSSQTNDKPNLGRPRHLDDAKRREVCALISVGTSMTDAAPYIGCAVATIRREALRNDEFSNALQRAFLGAELSPLHEMRNAAKSTGGPRPGSSNAPIRIAFRNEGPTRCPWKRSGPL